MPMPIGGFVKKNLKQSGIPILRGTPKILKNGLSWFDKSLGGFYFRELGRTWPLWTGGIGGYISGPAPLYESASQIRIKAGSIFDDDLGNYQIKFTSDLVVSLATAGAAGLDTGSEAANTFYYLWVFGKSSDGSVTACFSTQLVTPTAPVGFDLKRRLPFFVRNNASSNIIPFTVLSGWPTIPFIQYNVGHTYHNGTAWVNSPNQIYAAAPTSTYATLSNITNFVPPISSMARFKFNQVSANSVFAIRNDAATQEEYTSSFGITGTSTTNGRSETHDIGLSSAQAASIRLYVGTPTVYIDIIGVYVNL